MLKPLGAEPMTAAQAVVRALEDAADSAPNLNIARFWMSLYEYGYEVVRRPCKCRCHKVIQPGLVPCPECATDPDHSSR